MSAVTQMAARVFTRAWLACGSLTMLCVQPVTSWTIPTGYAYDPAVNRVTKTADGSVVDDVSAYYAGHTDTVNVVPGAIPSGLIELSPAGTVPDGALDVVVRGTDLAKVKAAWAVQLSGLWYNVTDAAGEPLETATAWALVRLQRRS